MTATELPCLLDFAALTEYSAHKLHLHPKQKVFIIHMIMLH